MFLHNGGISIHDKGEKMVIFIKGYIETLNYFMDSMAAGRDDTFFLNAEDMNSVTQQLYLLDSRIDENTVVICCNNIGVRISFGEGGGIYWERKKVRIYDILFDHPVNYLDTIAASYPNLQFITVDRFHRDFMRTNFPQVAEQTNFLPLAGTELDLFESADREIGVLYTGHCQKTNLNYPHIDFMRGKELDFYEFCYQIYMQDPYVEVDDVVDTYLLQSKRKYTYGERLQLISIVQMTVERRAMHDLKQKIIGALAEGGIPIRIYGANWEELKEKYPERVELGGRLVSEECIQKMGEAKLCLNMQPFFGNGGHDRVCNSMLNGAVCLSNRSRYLEERFVDETDILYIDFDHLDRTVEKVKAVLQDEKRWNHIRCNAYEKAKTDTWKQRLEQIIRKEYE